MALMNQPMQVGNQGCLFSGWLDRLGSRSSLCSVSRHGRQGGDQLSASALGIRLNVLNDALDAFRNRRCFQIKEARPRHTDMGDGFIDFEEMKSKRSELLAEAGSDLKREAHLVFTNLPYQPREVCTGHAAGLGSAETVRFDTPDDVLLMIFAEMLFDRFHGREADRFR